MTAVVDDLELRRRYYAEEIETTCNVKTAALVHALARVPREAFLPPGPWLMVGQGDIGGAPRLTPDGDPRRVYHNVSLAIRGDRMLFNGAPGVVSTCIDALGLRNGARVLHVGCGLGYYSALMAECVGPNGQVVAVDVEHDLADGARERLTGWPQVQVRQGNGVATGRESYDAILVNAGMTHPHAVWLDALAPGGRLVLPLTVAMPAMGPIGKGVVVCISRSNNDETWSARLVTMVAIYSAVDIRDERLNQALGRALAASPFPRLTRLRRDAHEPVPECWFHDAGFCLSS